jgi:hypothetical protein
MQRDLRPEDLEELTALHTETGELLGIDCVLETASG